jgi:hypothetical protein
MRMGHSRLEMSARDRLQHALAWGMAHCAAFAVLLGLSRVEFGVFAEEAWRQQKTRRKAL